MPSIVQEDQEMLFGKKRRWEDSLDAGRHVHLQQIQAKMSSPKSYTTHANFSVLPQPHQQPFTRVLKSIKRQRLDRTQSSPLPFSSPKSTFLQAHIPASPPTTHQNEPQPFLPLQSHHQEPTGAWSYSIKPKTDRKDLNPCHVCKRRPTLISELDQYTKCEGCGEKTCWICVRECEGWGVSPTTVRGGKPWGYGRNEKVEDADRMIDEEDESGVVHAEKSGWDMQSGMEDGHRSVVCSRCCIERGSDGEIWCLGCLRSESDGLD